MANRISLSTFYPECKLTIGERSASFSVIHSRCLGEETNLLEKFLHEGAAINIDDNIVIFLFALSLKIKVELVKIPSGKPVRIGCSFLVKTLTARRAESRSFMLG